VFRTVESVDSNYQDRESVISEYRDAIVLIHFVIDRQNCSDITIKTLKSKPKFEPPILPYTAVLSVAIRTVTVLYQLDTYGER